MDGVRAGEGRGGAAAPASLSGVLYAMTTVRRISTMTIAPRATEALVMFGSPAGGRHESRAALRPARPTHWAARDFAQIRSPRWRPRRQAGLGSVVSRPRPRAQPFR